MIGTGKQHQCRASSETSRLREESYEILAALYFDRSPADRYA
jgi:hypothetical protein